MWISSLKHRANEHSIQRNGLYHAASLRVLVFGKLVCSGKSAEKALHLPLFETRRILNSSIEYIQPLCDEVKAHLNRFEMYQVFLPLDYTDTELSLLPLPKMERLDYLFYYH